MNLDEEFTDLATKEHSTTLPITMDRRYNLIVCKECGIGLPFDWVIMQLKEHHRVKITIEEVMVLLNAENDAMTLAEAENWIQNMWIGTAVQNIPVVNGFRCHECQYSAATMKVMRNHFSKEHKGMKVAEYSKECRVQLVFKGGLQKYILSL